MDAGKFKKMIKQIEETMAAVSFAEQGELDAAEAFFRRERKVLVAYKEGRNDLKTFKYALNAAMRINAGVDVLCVAASEAPERGEIARIEEELKRAGVSYQITRRSGCLKKEIIDYTNKEREVVFVVVESPESLDENCTKKDGMLAELWKNLRCPLVVVSEAASG